jgi:hypothetical protein
MPGIAMMATMVVGIEEDLGRNNDRRNPRD